MPHVRRRGRAARQPHPPVGARAVRSPAYDSAGAGTPLPVRELRADVAAVHNESCCAQGEDLPRGLRWALEGIVIDHLTVSRVAAALGVSWHTANTAVLAEGNRRLIDDPVRFKGVSAIGVDEHVCRHTRRGDKYVTVIIDLTPIPHR